MAYNGIQDRARASAVASKESQVKKQLEVYKTAHDDTYPADQAAFDTLIGQAASDTYYTTYSSASPYNSYFIGSSATALGCPAGFIAVPGSSAYGTSSFCVMKYEAKNVNNTATSQASGTPWVSISQTSALTTAQSACNGCQLITEAQWMTIATNALSVPSNWSGGSVGSGYIYSGHNDNSPSNALVASTNDANGYEGTGNTSGNQRRTLTLTNGEVIWDFAGNVWEWTGGTMTGAHPTATGQSTTNCSWNDYTSITDWGNLSTTSRPTGTLYTRSQGVGGMCSQGGLTESTTRAFLRGGYWNYGSNAGVLALGLNYSSSGTAASLGFRVSR